MPFITSDYTTREKEKQSWVGELVKTVGPQNVSSVLLRTIRDISRSCTIKEGQKMHRIRLIVAGVEEYLRP